MIEYVTGVVAGAFVIIAWNIDWYRTSTRAIRDMSRELSRQRFEIDQIRERLRGR